MARYQIDDLIVDTAQRRLRRDGRWMPLSERSLAALLVLIDAGPEGASFSDLMRGAWSGAVVGEDTVKKRISLLRQEIGDRDEPQLIQSLRGRGYRIAGAVERIEVRSHWLGRGPMSPQLIGGIATVASIGLAVLLTARPASGLDPVRCGEGVTGPLISEIQVIADDTLGDHRAILAADVERAVLGAAQLGRDAPFRMSAQIMQDRGEPVLELTLRCGDPAGRDGGEAWAMRYIIDPDQPSQTEDAVNDLLARVASQTRD